MSDRLKLVGVVDRDPYGPLTWSGISVNLFTTLDKKGVLLGAVSAETSRATRLVYRVGERRRLATWLGP